MEHLYYNYNREALIKAPKIPLQILVDAHTVFETMAREMADAITENNQAGKHTVFILPVGPVGQYPYFIKLVNTEKISLKNCWFINMDEYLDDKMAWIDQKHPLSFRGYMEREVYSRIDPELNLPEEQRIFPDPENTAFIPQLIKKLGGVDICFGGIGINGHLAFNEPDLSLSCEAFRELKTRVLAVSPETRTANAIGDFGGRLEDMPKFCVTIGFSEISQAKKIRLGVFRDWHRAVVRRAAYGEKTTAFPVSLLADHQDVLIRMPESVACLDADMHS